MPIPRPARASGFSLVELSVVLVIIGLIIGGIMAGQNLIQQAKLSKMLTDIHKYRSAITQFRQQYGGYPGDLADAQDYWGIDNSGGGCPNGSTTPKKETCNGNGDSYIMIHTYESFRAWQHLADAGLIEGMYSGTGTAAHNYDDAQLGVNVPNGPFEGSGYTITFLPNYSGGGSWGVYTGEYGTLLYFGSVSSNSFTQGPILTPSEIYNADRKVDDGMPGTGILVTRSNSSYNGVYCTNDTNENDGSTAQYNLLIKSRACNVIYKLDQ